MAISTQAWMQQGQAVLETLKRNGGPLAKILGFVSLSPQIPFNTLYNSGVAALQAGELENAIAWLEQAYEADPEDAATCYNLGLAHEKNGDTETALAFFKAAAALDASDADTHYTLGRLYYTYADTLAESQSEGYFQAIQYLETARTLAPEDADIVQLIGATRFELEEYEAATAAAQEALALSENTHAGAWWLMARVREREEALQEAIAAYEQVLTLDADAPHAYELSHRISLLKAHIEDWEGVIKTCQRTIEIKPDFAKAYNQLGLAYYCLDRYPEAIETYQKALEIDEDYATAYNNMAYAYEKTEEWPEAIAAFEAYLSRIDDEDEILEIHARLDQLSRNGREDSAPPPAATDELI